MIGNWEPASDPSAGRAGLRVNSQAAVCRGDPRAAWVVPLLLDLGGEVSQYELNVSRYFANRVPGVNAVFLIQRAQERPLLFERTGYEHDTAKTLHERSHDYRIRFRNTFRPASEPLRPSGRFADASRPQKELEPYPDKNITTRCFVAGQVSPKLSAQNEKCEQSSSIRGAAALQNIVVGNQHVPRRGCVCDQILGQPTNGCCDSAPVKGRRTSQPC